MDREPSLLRHGWLLRCAPDRGERRTCGLKVGGELWDQANAISMETRRDVVAVRREEVRRAFKLERTSGLVALKSAASIKWR